MGEPHSGQRASAIGVLAEVRKSITSADTDFSIGGIAGLSSLIRISSRSILEPQAPRFVYVLPNNNLLDPRDRLHLRLRLQG